MISINEKLNTSWKVKLQKEFDSTYFQELILFLQKELKNQTVYPNVENIFTAFNQTHFDKVKIVIIGQDPYHGFGQANGLSFSVKEGTKKPPSLKNIFKELSSDLNIRTPESGNLLKWAEEGVLLLNSILTVKANSPGSHKKIGWEKFTNAAIKAISRDRDNIVFILWGKYAQEKRAFIDEKKHYILKSAHPSPFSAHKGFFGSKPFSKSNAYLQSFGIPDVKWSIVLK
jgi:uracil-DNA glycosylase